MTNSSLGCQTVGNVPWVGDSRLSRHVLGRDTHERWPRLHHQEEQQHQYPATAHVRLPSIYQVACFLLCLLPLLLLLLPLFPPGPRSPAQVRHGSAQPIPDQDKPSGSSRDVGLTSFYYSLVSVHLFRDCCNEIPPTSPLTLAASGCLLLYHRTPYEYSMTLAAPGFVTTGVQTILSASRQDASCPKGGACYVPRRHVMRCSAVQRSAAQRSTVVVPCSPLLCGVLLGLPSQAFALTRSLSDAPSPPTALEMLTKHSPSPA